MEALLELEQWRRLAVLIPLAAMLVPAATSDALYGRIPNSVTYPAFFVGLAAHTLALGWSALPWAFGASVSVLVAGLLLRIPGWIGGGDVKLLTSLAAFLGFGGLGASLFYAIWVGFVLGIAQIASRGRLIELLRRLGRFFRGLLRSIGYQTDQVLEELETGEDSEIPFAVAVFVGTIFAYTEARFGWPGLLGWMFPVA